MKLQSLWARDNPQPPPYDEDKATTYRYRQQRGVNLGSLFVLEQWMTPSLFSDAAGNKSSEIDVASGSGSTDAAREKLEKHWATFITQDDFNYLASIGINTVRLPIGYWILGSEFCEGTAYEPVASVYQNGWQAVMRVISMASEAGIGVLVDLHGAVGSQNGQPHSGISDGQAGLFANQDNQNRTIWVLRHLMEQLVDINNIVGIELLNEPQFDPGLNSFYQSAIESMRQSSPSAANFPLYIHDAFQLNSLDVVIPSRAAFLVQDHHAYFAYTKDDSSMSASEHTQDIRVGVKNSLQQIFERRNFVVGEWSCALTNESLSKGSPDVDQARKEFCEAQSSAYSDTSNGWLFWSYTMEDCEQHPDWCFRAAVGRSLPTNFFPYGMASYTEVNEQACNITLPDVPTLQTKQSQTKRMIQRNQRRDADPKDVMDQCWLTGYQAAKMFQSSPYKSKIGFLAQLFGDRFAPANPALSENSTMSGCLDRFRDGVRTVEACLYRLNRPSGSADP
ncbi:hypothetical protein AX16_004212 [Volvariella volvacea WC 439]|nr:hypothetical protein AX16_004212 [Volvariella volvacea WC 439]